MTAPLEAAATVQDQEQPAVAATTPEALNDTPLDETASKPRPAAPVRDLEATLGSRWSVWVGGLALALGGIFLVRYSIDEGLLGPGLRIILALLIGLAAMAAGEALRRSERRFVLASIPAANIPAILTAVGVSVVFGAIYAAHALYGFIDGTTTFILLALAAALALIASVLHGPALAALGLVGIYVTPILIGSPRPDYWVLVGYLAIATAACVALARSRQVLWIGLAALALATFWTVALVGSSDATPALGLHIVFAPALTMALYEYSHRRSRPTIAHDKTIALVAILTGLVGAVLWMPAQGSDDLNLRVTIAVVVIALAIYAAIRRDLWRYLLTAAAATGIAIAIVWPTSLMRGRFYDWDFRVFTSEPTLFLLTSAAIALLICVPAILTLSRPSSSAGDRGFTLAFTAALTPVALLAIAAMRIGAFSQDPAFAITAAALTLGLYLVAEHLRDRSLTPSASPAFAAAAAIGLGLFCTFALPGNWVHVGLAVASAGVALVSVRREFPLLTTMSTLLATAAALRFVADPPLSGFGDMIFFNDILWAYGLPAVAFGAGAWWLRRTAPAKRAVHEALAAIFALLFAVLQIRHAFHGPDGILDDHVGYLETVAFIASVLGVMALLVRISGQLGSGVVHASALIAAGIAAAGALWMITAVNPLFDRSLIEGPVLFNRLLFGYGLAAAAFAGASWIVRESASDALNGLLRTCALGLAGVAALVVLRNLFHGPDISYARSIWLDEGGAYVTIFFAAATLFAALSRRFPASSWGASAGGALFCGIVAALLVQGMITNPLTTRLPLAGPPFLDTTYVGYFLPALAAASAAAMLTRQRDRAVAGLAALAFGFCYVLIQIRRIFSGPDVAVGLVSNPESYTYSAVILGYGILILGVGFLLRSREIRLASAIAIVVAVLKVFLLDMAALEGIWRALSFIGLGLVMMGIGLLYQRLLARPEKRGAENPTITV